MRLLFPALLACAGAVTAADVVERDTRRESFQGAREMIVDNVTGSIEVEGYSGSVVEMVVERTIRADSADLAAEARRDVRLDIRQSGARAEIYVDGPFRDRRHGGVRIRRSTGYTVRHDFKLRTPEGVTLRLDNINDGDIRVTGTTGRFEIENVNGSVRISGAAGSGRVYAVNGKVQVEFRRSPDADSSFGSLNGNVDVTFPPDFSGDLYLKTFNGEAFTDFETVSLPSVVTPEKRDGKFVYRSNRFHGLRVGRGGPEIKFDAFNGNIYIRNRSKS